MILAFVISAAVAQEEKHNSIASYTWGDVEIQEIMLGGNAERHGSLLSQQVEEDIDTTTAAFETHTFDKPVFSLTPANRLPHISDNLLLSARLSSPTYLEKKITVAPPCAEKKHSTPISSVSSPAEDLHVPRPVEEPARQTRCPKGFLLVGKQCAKGMRSLPSFTCPEGTHFESDNCIKYVKKQKVCPPGYFFKHNICAQMLTSPVQMICPVGFTFTDEGVCVSTSAAQIMCPAGASRKGNVCVETRFVAPKHQCASGYIALGHKCQHEETYDCTPYHRNYGRKHNYLPHRHLQYVDFFDTASRSSLQSTYRWRKQKGRNYHVYVQKPYVEEFVVQQICKRITTRLPQFRCPDKAVLDGKLCRIEQSITHEQDSKSVKPNVIMPRRQCPQHYTYDKGDTCYTVKEVTPNLVCPENSVYAGGRCYIIVPSRAVCYDGLLIEGKTCVKTLFSPPIVEYTVHYACMGKQCLQ